MDSRVSVIIPAYNAADTIGEALASIRAQTVSPCEVTVVDDASTDRTVEVARKEAVISEGSGFRVRVLALSRNSGPAAARNAGIREAQSEWIAFLDADDTWLPGKLEIQLNMARAQPNVAMWCGEACDMIRRFTRINADDERKRENGTDMGDATREGERGFPSNQQPTTRQLELIDFVAGNPVATSTVLVRKEAVLAVGGFDEQFRGPEDYDLWMRIAAKYPVMKADAPLSLYRERSGSLSMDERKFLPEVLRVLDKAFGPGGVFETLQDLKPTSLSNQYWNAAWMAFQHGSRTGALMHLIRACALNWKSAAPVSRRWFPMFLRYAFGRM